MRKSKTGLTRAEYLARQKQEVAKRKSIIRDKFDELKAKNPSMGRLKLYEETARTLQGSLPNITTRMVKESVPSISKEETIKVMQKAGRISIEKEALKKATTIRYLYLSLLKEPEVRKLVKKKGITALDQLLADSFSDISKQTIMRARLGKVGTKQVFPQILRPEEFAKPQPKGVQPKTRKRSEKPSGKGQELMKQITTTNVLLTKLGGEVFEITEEMHTQELRSIAEKQKEALKDTRAQKREAANRKRLEEKLKKLDEVKIGRTNAGAVIKGLQSGASVHWSLVLNAEERAIFRKQILPNLPEEQRTEIEKFLKRVERS